jgi:hypothetical protein
LILYSLFFTLPGKDAGVAFCFFSTGATITAIGAISFTSDAVTPAFFKTVFVGSFFTSASCYLWTVKKGMVIAPNKQAAATQYHQGFIRRGFACSRPCSFSQLAFLSANRWSGKLLTSSSRLFQFGLL